MKRWLRFRRSACILLAAAGALPSILIAQVGEVDAPSEEPSQASEASPPPRPPARVWRALKDEAKRYGRDSVALIKKPLSWKKKQWEKAGGAVLVIGGLMLADKSIDDAARRQRSHFTDRVAGATTSLGVSMDSTLQERCSPRV